MEAKSIADKYISRGGGKPVMDAKDFASDLITLSSFILWHDPRAMHGGAYKEDAYSAMCRLLNVEPHRIQEIIRPE